MKINTVSYFISDAFKSLKRNKTISIASVITVLITFLVLGVFSLVAENANLVIGDVQSKVALQVYLLDDVKLLDKREIEVKLREQPGVKEIQHESKEQAFKNFEKDNKGMLTGYTLDTNPFPESYIVQLEDPSYADSVIATVEDLPGVESITGQKEYINKVHSVVRGVRVVGIVLFVILIGVSIFLIMNTIKLTVYSRRREVGIMKFVGATDWFIRWPFVIEGMVIGLVGSMLSIVALIPLYNAIFNWLINNMVMINLVNTSYILASLSWKFAIGGIFVGGVASFGALRKFLRV